MDDGIRVLVTGAAGRMGREVVKAVCGADGLPLRARLISRWSGRTPATLPASDQSASPFVLISKRLYVTCDRM